MVEPSLLTAGAEKLTGTQTEELNTDRKKAGFHRPVSPIFFLRPPKHTLGHLITNHEVRVHNTRWWGENKDTAGQPFQWHGWSEGALLRLANAPAQGRGLLSFSLSSLRPAPHKRAPQGLTLPAEPRKAGRIALDAQCAQEGFSSLWPRAHVSQREIRDRVHLPLPRSVHRAAICSGDPPGKLQGMNEISRSEKTRHL